MERIIDDIPKEYWEDSNWAYEHINELTLKYPNQFVAVYKKQVIGYGKSSSEARRKGKKKVGDIQFPVIFAEKGGHIYANQS